MANRKKPAGMIQKAAKALDHVLHPEEIEQDDMDQEIDQAIDSLDEEQFEEIDPKQKQIKSKLHPKFHKFIK